MKKLIVLLLALILCFGTFAGCKKDKDNGGNGEDAWFENGGSLEGVEFNERNGEMYKDTKDGKTMIKISYTPGFGNGWARQMAKEFLLSEQGAKYYIKLDSDSELTTAVSSKLEAGMNLSDIYFPLASNWQSYAALGQLEPLDDLYNMTVPGETKTVLEKIEGTWKDYGKAIYNNETNFYCFPGNENITGIVYNKTMFDKYGWTVPNTVEELKALCQKIIADTNGKVAPFVYPGTVPGGYWDFIGTNWWLQVSGAEKMNTFMQFESAEVYSHLDKNGPSYGKLKMLETFEDLIVDNRTTFTLKGSASKSHLLAQTSFAQGQAAMIPNGNWIQNESLQGMKDEVRMMAVPLMKDVLKDEAGNPIRYNYSGQPDYIIIPSGAKNKEGAKKFLAFCCKDEMLKKYTTLTGTPRPFAYDISECETSEFIKSCLDIWSNSTTWFESSTNKLWTANKAKKFVTINPYGALLADDTITALGWCATEYKQVKASWNTWLDAIK